jgi:hypothetical protein
LRVSTALRERETVRARDEVAAQARGAAPPAWALPALVAVGVGLRVWAVLSNGLTFDETFTAMAGRLRIGDLLSYLRHYDSHPPLDYLLRAPPARAGASDFVLRFPSLVFSSAALALFAWWMRRRGWMGVIATALMAVSTFQLVYGSEARMYALLQLLGVGAAMVAEQWLGVPRRWHAWAAGGLLLVALFDHVSGGLLAAGLLAVAGLRRDREAWRWRVAVVVAGLVWAAAWGPSMLQQLGGNWASWIPRTTLGGFTDTVSRQFTLAPYVGPFLLVGVIGGGYLLVRREPVLGRVWLALGALPFLLAALIGFFSSFLFDRTLSLASWAPLLAVAFLLERARVRYARAGVAIVTCVVVVLAAASTTFLLDKKWDYDLSVDRLEQVARPGDVIAVRPARYGILVDWRIGVRGSRPTHHVTVAGMPAADALAVGRAPRSGRVWLLTPVGSRTSFPGFSTCAPRWTDDVTEILCLRAPS